MQRTNIPSEIAQEVFESATNAAEKGLSQFFTPPALARHLAGALPRIRPIVTDLTCGRGDLLHGAANDTTRFLLGSDIHNARKAEGLEVRFTQSDVTTLYPLLCEVNWQADVFTLNGPWRCFWHRDRLAELAASEVPAVRRAFAGLEAGIPKGTIDSTPALLMIALDRCTLAGEGYLIANDRTLERLIFARGAPHSDLAAHCWARVILPGNPMTGLDGCQWQEDEQFATGIVFFARDHDSGPHTLRWTSATGELPHRARRLGHAVRNQYAANEETLPRWNIVREQVGELAGRKPKVPWNLWLDAAGYLRTALSSFEQNSRKLNKAQAKRLFALNGKSPLQLVLQRADREEVLDIARHGGWRVQPELIAAIEAAVRAYHASRAPLYPLNEIQRLGYADEHDTLTCRRDFGPFHAGTKYPLRSQSLTITRRCQKPNMIGGLEEFESTRQELALFLDVGGREYSFLDATLQADPQTKIPEARRAAGRTPLPDQKVDFTLQQLVEHFEIPEVPDVASADPARYQQHLDQLDALESAIAELA